MGDFDCGESQKVVGALYLGPRTLFWGGFPY